MRELLLKKYTAINRHNKKSKQLSQQQQATATGTRHPSCKHFAHRTSPQSPTKLITLIKKVVFSSEKLISEGTCSLDL